MPAVRAPASTFWGKVWHESPPYQQREMPTMNIDLALPLPPLTAEVFVDANGVVETSIPERSRPTFVPKEDRPVADERVDLFVVKQLGGRKRKRTGAENPEDQPSSAQKLDPMINDEIMLDNDEHSEEAVQAREKEARRAARKQKKKELAAEAAALNYDDEPAFDYAKRSIGTARTGC